MGAPKRTWEELEPSWVAAYELRRDGWSLPDIAAELAGPPHNCGSKSTAARWVKEGRAVLAAKGDPLRKRQARREMAVDALDAIRVQADLLAKSDRDVDPVDLLRIKMMAIEKAARIGGFEAPRPTARVKVTGSGGKPQIPAELFESLAAIPVDDLLDALHTLPDERTDR